MSTTTSTMFRRTIGRVLCLTPLLAAIGCGADFDSPDWVKSLRVLGIQKDKPYAPPTTDPTNPSEVNLTMLDYNPTQYTKDPKPIQRLWFSGCDDLPGDQYFTCLAYMNVLWKQYKNPPDGIPARSEWQDGMTWSPLDDIMADPHLINSDPNLTDDERVKATDDNRMQAAQALVSQVRPNFPPELAESYLGTLRIGSGPRFVYPIPPLIIDYHRASSDPSIPAFGLSFIFFTVCAGHIDVAPNWQNIDIATTLHDATLGFPFVCLDNGSSADAGTVANDNSGNALGPDDFVSGYTQLFVYGDGTANHNPVISGVIFSGPGINRASDADAGADAGAGANADAGADAGVVLIPETSVDPGAYCIDGACVPPVTSNESLPDPCNGTSKLPHVHTCTGKCPTYTFSPTMEPKDNNDKDIFASDEKGTNVGEQMWIDYYADRGKLKHTVKLLRDGSQPWFPSDIKADSGWSNDQDHSNPWTPPSDAGLVNLWAVAHDTRGGTAWVRLQVCVDP